MANKNNNNANNVKLVVPGRLSYASIWEPSEPMGGGDPKYRTAVLIPKSDKKTLEKINAAIESAKQIGAVKKWGGKIPANLKLPMHDGDIEKPDDENYEGMMYFNCSSKEERWSRPNINYLLIWRHFLMWICLSRVCMQHFRKQ